MCEPVARWFRLKWRAAPLAARVHEDDLDDYVFNPLEMDEAVVREVRLRRSDGSYLQVREVVRSVRVKDRHYLRGVILVIAADIAARAFVDLLSAVVAHPT